jgi:hypothetical protein
MTRTINISLNVPETYGVEELTQQLTEYGEKLIARRRTARESDHRPSRNFLRGFSLPKGKSAQQLIVSRGQTP